MTKTKFHPILFSTLMVQAILENRKTQTRRVIKLPNYHPSAVEKQKDKMTIKDWILYDGNQEVIGNLKCPYNLGDVLWVRETFAAANSLTKGGNEFSHYVFKADNNSLHNHFKWKPSLFMPKEACRLFLKIKSIRVQQLHDISEEDAIAEGVESKDNQWRDYYYKDSEPIFGTRTATRSFRTLWYLINGVDSFLQNPFVWVYEFEKIEKPLDFGI